MKLKLTTLSAAAAAMFVFASSAQAREHHRHHFAHREARSHYYVRRYAGGYQAPEQSGFAMMQQFSAASWSTSWQGYSGRVGARPAAWCGWEMRQLVGGDPGPEYNLARNWAHWGRPGPAGVGAVVVWSHHVGKIVGQEGGEWLIESGNDGHAVRTRPRSLGGVIAIRWG
jgi:hypothetical protein